MTKAAALAGAVAAAALAACGGGDAGAGAEATDPSTAIRRATVRVRDANTFAFDAESTRTRTGEEPQRYLTADGELDLAEGRGRMTLDVSKLFDLGGRGNEALSQPVELWWDRTTLYGRVKGTVERASRAQARGSLIGRVPDEPAALVELLALADRPRKLGEERVGATDTVGYGFVVDARAVRKRRIPAEAPAALARRELPMEVWLDERGLPRRIAYVLESPPLRRDGRQILPARTVRVQYDLRAFGDDVDVEPPG